MYNIKLTEAQAMAVINILNSQSVPFNTLESYLGVLTALKSLNQDDGFYELSISDSDLSILLMMIENGSILIKEIPFAVNLLNILSIPINPDNQLPEERSNNDSL